jgi:hypothetical protein
MNREMYMDILLRPGDEIRRKRPEKWRTNNRFLLHHNAPTHRPVLVRDFLAKNNVTTLEHPPYVLGLASADFYLFPRLKSQPEGRRFCDATDITKNAMEEMKRLSQNGFQECFKHHCRRWPKCTFEQADNSEGNVA